MRKKNRSTTPIILVPEASKHKVLKQQKYINYTENVCKSSTYSPQIINL